MEIQKLNKITKTYLIDNSSKLLIKGIKQGYTKMKVSIQLFTSDDSGIFYLNSSLFNDKIFISAPKQKGLNYYNDTTQNYYFSISSDINNEYNFDILKITDNTEILFNAIVNITFSN